MLKSDRWIRKMAHEHDMINPFSEKQVREGVVSYGYGLMSERISFGEFIKMFHANNERIDQESLRLSTELFEQTARAFVG